MRAAQVGSSFFSADGEQRNLLVLLVAGNSLRAGIERRMAVDEETVVMMSVVQLDLGGPGTIELLFHGHRFRMPVIKVANEGNLLCLWGNTNKVDGFNHLLG